MKRILILLALISPAFAEEVPTIEPATQAAPKPPEKFTLDLTPQDKALWAQLPRAMSECASLAAMDGNVTSCRLVRDFLAGFAERVKAAKPVE